MKPSVVKKGTASPTGPCHTITLGVEGEEGADLYICTNTGILGRYAHGSIDPVRSAHPWATDL